MNVIVYFKDASRAYKEGIDAITVEGNKLHLIQIPDFETKGYDYEYDTEDVVNIFTSLESEDR